jgi:hypothetical protein
MCFRSAIYCQVREMVESRVHSTREEVALTLALIETQLRDGGFKAGAGLYT